MKPHKLSLIRPKKARKQDIFPETQELHNSRKNKRTLSNSSTLSNKRTPFGPLEKINALCVYSIIYGMREKMLLKVEQESKASEWITYYSQGI